MNEKRRFHRVRFKCPCEMSHKCIAYKGQLENISLNGALISFEEGVIVPENDECLLKVYMEGESSLLQMAVRVIYSNFTMVGVQFSAMEAADRKRLSKLMEALSNDPVKIAQELKLLDSES